MSEAAHQIRILVIDDEPMNLELAVAVLEPGGYAVRTATTAAWGLELAVTEQPALILMDLHFPTGMKGIEATRRLKVDPRTTDIPVVALTALTQQRAEQEARDVGFASYLSKPLDATALRATIRQLTGGGEGARMECG